MVRIALISLLLGIVALIASLALFFPPQNASQQQGPVLTWDANTTTTESGTPTVIDSALQLTLDSTGVARVTLAANNIAAADYSFLHLSLEQSHADLAVTINWVDANNPQDFRSYTLESRARQSLWLATDEIQGWAGSIGTLGLAFSGPPGETILIRDFSLYPASALRQMQAIYSDLSGYASWNSSAMNTYKGVFKTSSFYPVVLAVALMVLSLLAYAVLLLVFRSRLQFDPAVVVLIFFANWILLDVFWQHRLLHQVVDTHRIFAGKTTEEKLAVGPDAPLYHLATQVNALIEHPESRIFVTSTDPYSGLRTAYYFFPRNVYWSLYSRMLPPKKALHEGDYLVLVDPSPYTFDRKRNVLVAPKRGGIRAEFVYSDHAGTVVRVK